MAPICRRTLSCTSLFLLLLALNINDRDVYGLQRQNNMKISLQSKNHDDYTIDDTNQGKEQSSEPHQSEEVTLNFNIDQVGMPTTQKIQVQGYEIDVTVQLDGDDTIEYIGDDFDEGDGTFDEVNEYYEWAEDQDQGQNGMDLADDEIEQDGDFVDVSIERTVQEEKDLQSSNQNANEEYLVPVNNENEPLSTLNKATTSFATQSKARHFQKSPDAKKSFGHALTEGADDQYEHSENAYQFEEIGKKSSPKTKAVSRSTAKQLRQLSISQSSKQSNTLNTELSDEEIAAKNEELALKKEMLRKGEDYYEKAMDMADDGQEETAFDLFIKAHDHGYPKATYELGVYYLDGDLVERNSTLAQEYFTNASLSKEPLSMTQLGFMWKLGIGTPEINQENARSYFKSAATYSQDDAKHFLAYQDYDRYLQGELDCLVVGMKMHGVCYTYSTNMEHSPSRYEGIILYEDEIYNPNSGMEDDVPLEDQIDLEQQYADYGDTAAHRNLAYRYLAGDGVPINRELAEQHLNQAIAEGDGQAMFNMGYIHLTNDPPNYAAAHQYFEMAADAGIAAGHNGLASIYMSGLGVEQDDAKAIQYLTMAADRGHADAMYNLGQMYYVGQGVAKDYELAWKYFNGSYHAGLNRAAYYLGRMHYNGEYVERSCPTSVEYFKICMDGSGSPRSLLNEAYDEYLHQNYFLSFLQYGKVVLNSINAIYTLNSS
eukprot:TRINITY_DN5365_c0_g1_i3.p1 TRINITY_DN5365_c0_g1~~TRINITY_DN5365_c0_g1_i3.p1  ORF type:complete len:713 (+),score=143.74 TRINITY_DN5365_c0_g1_i3:53-2191(+)